MVLVAPANQDADSAVHLEQLPPFPPHTLASVTAFAALDTHRKAKQSGKGSGRIFAKLLPLSDSGNQHQFTDIPAPSQLLAHRFYEADI